MVKGFVAWLLALTVMGVLAAGCDLFSPQSSKSTIEVSFTYTGSSCNLQAALDGSSSMGVGPGSYASFPPVDPGSHTVSLSAGGGCPAACTFQNGSVNYSVTFNTSAGNFYVVKVAAGANCPNLVVSGP